MQNSVKSVPSYFKNLDGLRFIAALFVIIGHAQSMVQDRLGINPYIGFADKLATFGVDFFFVLSGFLISFLMYAELAETGTIHIRKFYIRRILRLWPLYYLFGFASILMQAHTFISLICWTDHNAGTNSGKTSATSLFLAQTGKLYLV